jgi:hypothetical protein
MFSEIILVAWTGAGLTWWIFAWRLVTADQSESPPEVPLPSDRSLSVFKPLPPLGEKGLGRIAVSLESFVSQLDSTSEMLLGVHEADRNTVSPFLNEMRKKYPEARLKVVFRTEPDDVANPKIAWQKILTAHAEGELWLWSDVDIIAPPHFLQLARVDHVRDNVTMTTFPYVIHEIPSPPALFEALFVNVEFYPGVLLLRKSGSVDFGLGAAMLFQRDDFLRKINWDELGASLADDFFLGQNLRPIQIGRMTLTTLATESRWKEALRHDLRWSKTIRWNRPAGFFARILVLPVLGWLGYMAMHPTNLFAWLGLVGMIQADVFFAAMICRRVGCPLNTGNLMAMEGWSLWRIVLWFLCWLPLPVIWNGRSWRKPREILKST